MRGGELSAQRSARQPFGDDRNVGGILAQQDRKPIFGDDSKGRRGEQTSIVKDRV